MLLKDQFTSVAAVGPHDRLEIPIDTMNTYVRNQWVRRVDVDSPQLMFPPQSMWKITTAGMANIAPNIALFLVDPNTIWMVRSVHLSPQNNMAQCIRFLNFTLFQQDGSRQEPRYELHKIAEYMREGWIERVDVEHLDDHDVLDEGMDCDEHTQNQYLVQ